MAAGVLRDGLCEAVTSRAWFGDRSGTARAREVPGRDQEQRFD